MSARQPAHLGVNPSSDSNCPVTTAKYLHVAKMNVSQLQTGQFLPRRVGKSDVRTYRPPCVMLTFHIPFSTRSLYQDSLHEAGRLWTSQVLSCSLCIYHSVRRQDGMISKHQLWHQGTWVHTPAPSLASCVTWANLVSF